MGRREGCAGWPAAAGGARAVCGSVRHTMYGTKTRKVMMPTRPLALGLVALICCGAVSVGLLSCTSKSTPVLSISLSWDYEGPLPASFQIDRSLDVGHTWTVYEQGVAPMTRTFTDTAPAGAYPCYRVSAIATPPAL